MERLVHSDRLGRDSGIRPHLNLGPTGSWGDSHRRRGRGRRSGGLHRRARRTSTRTQAGGIEEAERQLEEAKRQMQLMGRKLAPEPDTHAWSGAWFRLGGRSRQEAPVEPQRRRNALFPIRDVASGLDARHAARPGHHGSGKRQLLVRRRRPSPGPIPGVRSDLPPRLSLDAHRHQQPDLPKRSGSPSSSFTMPGWSSRSSKNKAFYLGAGLLYWNGISRQTNASTITLMSLDPPIMNWPLIERDRPVRAPSGHLRQGKARALRLSRSPLTRPFTAFDVSLTGNSDGARPDGGREL